MEELTFLLIEPYGIEINKANNNFSSMFFF